ncbi:MAG: ATP-binding protein, partial [Thermodesulfobacteriota bacterium]|nr:ATP-binding protein [Thermodesulfobacteriota bacterium]
KFTPDGGEIHVAANVGDDSWLMADSIQENTADREPGADGHGSTASRKFIRISVTDNGIGLNREDLGRIFNPFEQVENSMSRKYQGTGLGLSLTRNLVKIHGGRIWAESEGEGKGSTFHFMIPV